MSKSKYLLFIIFILSVFTCGCAARDVLSVEASVMVEPTAMPTAKPSPAPTAAPTPSPTPEPVRTAKISVVGDIMLHEWQVNDAYDKESKTYDFNKGFSVIKPYLNDSDLTIGNLETVFAGDDRGFRDFPRFNGLRDFAVAIRDAGFDLLTTANNHSNDQGTDGILNTLTLLDELGIEHMGTYAAADERENILVKEINGIRFAFLSYTYGTNGLPLPADKPYLVNIMSENLLNDDIARARALSDFVVVMPHMGNEYELQPKQVFKNWVQLMCDAGADVVLASHPHVLQGDEFITAQDGRECYAIYSLGNFISSQRDLPRDAGLILNLYFEYDKEPILKNVEYIPTWVKFINNSGVYDIKVLPVKDSLDAIESGNVLNLRPKDINRLKNVLSDAEKIYKGDIR